MMKITLDLSKPLEDQISPLGMAIAEGSVRYEPTWEQFPAVWTALCRGETPGIPAVPFTRGRRKEASSDV